MVVSGVLSDQDLIDGFMATFVRVKLRHASEDRKKYS